MAETNTGTRQSGLPRATYTFRERFEDYVLDQMGVTVGHQGFNNNILLAESFMKILPQTIIAIRRGVLNNIYTKLPPKITLDKLFVERINQIWTKGLHCIIIRDPDDELIVKERTVAYKSAENSIIIKDQKINDPWEIKSACQFCSKPLVGMMKDQGFNVKETRCMLMCTKCNYIQEVEVEVKPPFQEMHLVRDRSYHPMLVQIRAVCMAKFALADLDLVNLSSIEGGYYHVLENKKLDPIWKTFEELENSKDTVSWVSQKYFDDTIGILYDEFLFFYNELLVLMSMIQKEMKQLPAKSNDRQRPDRILAA